MSEERANSNLLQARDTYVRRFVAMVGPYVLAIFDNMYSRLEKHPLRVFQTSLREIPDWNASVIKQHSDYLTLKSDCLDEMVAALFVSQVKILTSIRLSAQKKSVSLKIPSNEEFLHRYFIEVARQFYQNPYMFRRRETRKKKEVLYGSVDEAVNHLLPHRKILRACLGDFVNEDRSFDTFQEDADRRSHQSDNRYSQDEDVARVGQDEMQAMDEVMRSDNEDVIPRAPTSDFPHQAAPPVPEPQASEVRVVSTPDGHVETINDAPFTSHERSQPVYDDFFEGAANLP